MSTDPKSRVEQAVPKPETAKNLDESEKEALELSGEIEHAHGEAREEAAEKAEELEGDSGVER